MSVPQTPLESCSRETTPRVAVVGCGRWGRNIVRNLAEVGALRALVGRDPEALRALASAHGSEAKTFNEALADTEIDAVALALPPDLNARFARTALEAGKHVFIEKPLALNVAEAEEICALADRLDRRLMVGHILQYHPAFRALCDLVHDGALGPLRHISARRANFGRFHRNFSVLWSLAPHDVSMILSLYGGEPESVGCVGSCCLDPRRADTAAVLLSFRQDRRAEISVSWLHPRKEQKLVVVGETGMAVFDDDAPWPEKLHLFSYRIEWRDGTAEPCRGKRISVPVEPAEPLRLELQHFLESIESGRTPRTDGWEALRVVRILARAEEALRSHRKE